MSGCHLVSWNRVLDAFLLCFGVTMNDDMASHTPWSMYAVVNGTEPAIDMLFMTVLTTVNIATASNSKLLHSK